jgi:hypothetical protein
VAVGGSRLARWRSSSSSRPATRGRPQAAANERDRRRQLIQFTSSGPAGEPRPRQVLVIGIAKGALLLIVANWPASAELEAAPEKIRADRT